jgi:cytochrome c-type biogenesis protein CcmE
LTGKRKIIIGVAAICLAVVLLGYFGFMGGATYYYEVGELLDQGAAVSGQTVRVHGEVGTDINQDGLDLSFSLKDSTGRDAGIKVTYHDAVPDTFGAGGELVVQGIYQPGGTFQAESILAKCASKYTPAA